MNKNVTGFSMVTGPGMKPIITQMTKDSPRPYMPKDLPTYQRLQSLHMGDPEMEVRMRAASLEDSCFHLDTENPPAKTLTGRIFRTGTVSQEQAEELRVYVRSLNEDDQYLRDEVLLLLEAGGHLMTEE